MAITTNFATAITALVDSLEAAEKLEFSEAIFNKSVQISPIAKDHAVLTGVRNGNLVPVIDDQPNYESFPFSDSSACAVPECDLSHNYSTVKWELGLIECKIPICLRSFNDGFLKFWNQYKMIQTDQDKNENDYLNSALIQFLYNQFKTNHVAAQWRGAYFGDKASASSLFDGIDGWFTQAAAGSNVITITENAGLTFADQTLTGLEIYGYIKQMYEAMIGMSWQSDQPLEFRMGKKLAQTLAAHLTFAGDNACCDGVEILKPEAIASAPYPYQRLVFHGIPIRVMDAWDDIVNKTSELNTGWVGGVLTNPAAPRVDPNRILLTYKNNLVLGTQEQTNLSFFDIWHSRDDDKIYMKGGSYFGAAMPHVDDYILAI